MVALLRMVAHSGKDELCPHALGNASQQRLVLDDLGVGENDVQMQLGGMRSQGLEVVRGREANGLTGVQPRTKIVSI